MSVIDMSIKGMKILEGSYDAPAIGTAAADIATGLTRVVLYVAPDSTKANLTNSDTARVPNVVTYLEGALKNGKVPALQYVGGYGNAVNQTAAAEMCMKSIAISTVHITLAPTTNDYSTAGTWTASDTFGPYFAIMVAFSVT